MEFRILGPVEILDGERVVPLGGLKRRAVVAVLLLHPNRVVASQQLIDEVWGDAPPASALGSLQNHVLRLRRELGDRLATRSPGYLLRVEPGELDLDRFRRLVDEARAREPDEAAALLHEALALWRGEPLADLAGQPAWAAAAVHLAELRLEALESRVDADLAVGRHATLVAELEALVGEHPFRERLRGQLMLSLYRSGRQADALEAYAAARATLVDELGAEPSPELQELQRAILRQDVEIARPAAVALGESAARIEEARKTVTVLLADLAAESASDPEVRRDRLRRCREEAVAALDAYGGTSGRTADTRVLGIFGVPVAQEDDALRAVRAARALVAAGLVARVGVATGDVITGDPALGRPLVSGPPLEEADRLLAAGGEANVLLGERAWRLVRHAVTAEQRGRVHAVEHVLEDAEPVVRRLETPLVGREDELAEIMATFRRVTRDDRARLVTVFGSPGVGKTRLAHEVVDALAGSATGLFGRASQSDAPTFSPLRDALSSLAAGNLAPWAAHVLAPERDGAAVAATIAAAAGETQSTVAVEETAWAARRLLETVARSRPVVLVLDDLHWASPAFLDLIEHVAELARAPILVLGLARPELVESRPAWAAGTLNASSILLDALPREQARDLLERLAADTQLEGDDRTAILAGAGGNPLFLEQLLAATLESGETTIPDSIHALLSARLDRLADDEREVAQAAAVCGQSFATDVLQSLVRADVGVALRSLARRDLVQPESPGGFGEETWGFRHALVRDEAYAGIPKRRRATFHRQAAAALEERADSGGIDADELVAHHLESAYRATLEVDPHARELAALAAEASSRLVSAGRRAYEESDNAKSVGLLRRAAELLPQEAAERLALAPVLADALWRIDQRDEAARVLDEAIAAARPEDAHARARLGVARHHLSLWGAGEHQAELILDDVRRAITVLERAGDHEALASAYLVAYHVSYRRAAGAPRLDSEEQVRLAAQHARAAGSRHLEAIAASWLCVNLRRGRQPVEEAKPQVLGVLADPPAREAYAAALGGLGLLRAMEGTFDEGRALVAQGHAVLEELGLRHAATADLINLADVEIMAGDLAAAERMLRTSIAGLDAVGDGFSAVNAAWRLAAVLAAAGRDDEAAAYVQRAGEVDAGEWVEAWRLVLGATLDARRGERSNARRLIDQADRLVAGLDEGGMQVDILRQAAEASEIAGDVADATSRLERATDLASRLGYVVAERAARERLGTLQRRTDG